MVLPLAASPTAYLWDGDNLGVALYWVATVYAPVFYMVHSGLKSYVRNSRLSGSGSRLLLRVRGVVDGVKRHDPTVPSPPVHATLLANLLPEEAERYRDDDILRVVVELNHGKEQS